MPQPPVTAVPDMDAEPELGVNLEQSALEEEPVGAATVSGEVVTNEAASADNAGADNGGDSPVGEENDGAEDGQTESVFVMPLDFMHVRVMLDGRSSVDHEQAAYVSLFFKTEPTDDDVETAGGSAAPGTECTLHLFSGATPSSRCMVRLRGEGGEAVVCDAQLETEEAATPESVERLYKQEAAAEEAARMKEEAGEAEPDAEVEGEAEAEGDEAGLEGEDEGEGEGGEEEGEQEEKEPDGFLDTGGSGGAVVFECPETSELQPVMDGNRKLLFVDVSLDGGETWDEASDPRLSIK